MKQIRERRLFIAFWLVTAGAAAAMAQNSVLVFSPVNVRASTDGTGYGAAANVFNSTTLDLACSTPHPVAVLSSTADGRGRLLVDNSISVSVNPEAGSGPSNICLNDRSNTPGIVAGNCFTSAYQVRAGALVGDDPDSLAGVGGVAPIDISSYLPQGASQVQIGLTDTGGYLANSSVYLNTNCTVTGVSGPANITGNPIPGTNPTAQQLTQAFAFNTAPGQQIRFVYDLSQAQAANTLSITPGTIPGTEDQPVDPASFRSAYLAGNSFATSSCLLHSGESLNGQPACKLYTLACVVGTSAEESGAQCPVSSLPNEIFQDVFDGPAFSLSDIPTPNGPTFHEGLGLLMAAEGWNGGPCTFDPASGLQDLPCPQNLLINFSGPGLYILSGGTSHPNSTFVAVAHVPEDLTTVTVSAQQPGGWISTHSPVVRFSSQPPMLAGTSLPGAAAFVPSPIESITYGISPAANVPVPGNPPATDIVLSNSISCPAPADPLDPPAAVFTPAPQSVRFPADGAYLLHYYAQDCAGTREYLFQQDPNGSWSTNYYTVAVNVDTVAPSVTSGPTLSPRPGANGAYSVGQTVTATYSCADDRSGLTQCGTAKFSWTAAQLNSGTITSPVDTATPGQKTFTVTAIDAAGNRSSATASYTVAAPYDSAIRFRLDRNTVEYPHRVNGVVRIPDAHGHDATGTVQLYDGSTLLETRRVRREGGAHFRIGPLAVGVHQLSVTYSGDAYHAPGQSAPVTLTVTPADADGNN